MHFWLKFVLFGVFLWLLGYFQTPRSGLRVVFSSVRFEGNRIRHTGYPEESQAPDTTKELSIADFDALEIKSVELEPLEIMQLLAEMYPDHGDSVTTSLCYRPRHAIQFVFPDASVRLMGFCFECHTGYQYGRFGNDLIMTNRFWRYLSQLKAKYEL